MVEPSDDPTVVESGPERVSLAKADNAAAPDKTAPPAAAPEPGGVPTGDAAPTVAWPPGSVPGPGPDELPRSWAGAAPPPGWPAGPGALPPPGWPGGAGAAFPPAGSGVVPSPGWPGAGPASARPRVSGAWLLLAWLGGLVGYRRLARHDAPAAMRFLVRGFLVGGVYLLVALLVVAGVPLWQAVRGQGAEQILAGGGSGGGSSSAGATVPATAVPTVPPTETEAAAALARTADQDRATFTAQTDGLWVPQISSKKVGLVVQGQTFDNRLILTDHLALRARYPDARLLRSDDFTSFRGDGLWVTVVAQFSGSAAQANAWCDRQGLPRDDCFAKRLSTVIGPEGSTVYRR